MSNSYYSKNKPQQEQREAAECYDCLRSEISDMSVKGLLDVIEQSARIGDDYYRRLANPENELTMTDETRALYRDRCNLFIGLHDMAITELQQKVDRFLDCKREQAETEKENC